VTRIPDIVKHKVRKGNTGATGRPRIYPLGTVVYKNMVTLSDEEYAAAVTLGDGNMSQGLRRAIAIAAQTLPTTSPRERYAAFAAATQERKHADRLAFAKKLGMPSTEEAEETAKDDARYNYEVAGTPINLEAEVTQSELEEWEL
jgi:hypothetical protein